MAPNNLTEAVKAEQSLASRLDDYAGKWVAVDDDRHVVAAADTLGSLLGSVQTDEIDRILEVSKEAGGACFF